MSDEISTLLTLIYAKNGLVLNQEYHHMSFFIKNIIFQNSYINGGPLRKELFNRKPKNILPYPNNKNNDRGSDSRSPHRSTTEQIHD